MLAFSAKVWFQLFTSRRPRQAKVSNTWHGCPTLCGPSQRVGRDAFSGARQPLPGQKLLHPRRHQSKNRLCDFLLIALILNAGKDDQDSDEGQDKGKHHGVLKNRPGEMAEISKDSKSAKYNKDGWSMPLRPFPLWSCWAAGFQSIRRRQIVEVLGIPFVEPLRLDCFSRAVYSQAHASAVRQRLWLVAGLQVGRAFHAHVSKGRVE